MLQLHPYFQQYFLLLEATNFLQRLGKYLVLNCIQEVLKPRGVAVVVEAQHECMTTRGINTPGISMVTSQLLGKFRTDASTRREFYSMLNQGPILRKN